MIECPNSILVLQLLALNLYDHFCFTLTRGRLEWDTEISETGVAQRKFSIGWQEVPYILQVCELSACGQRKGSHRSGQ